MELNQEPLILIVDDNPTNIKLLFSYLKDTKFKILIANDGESALEKLKQVIPDLILLDVMMPGINGFETCRQIKANKATQDIPIIFMTAIADPIYKVQGLEVGAVDYITKPFQQEEVLARIKLQLKMRNLTKKLENQNMILKREIAARTAAEAQLKQLTQELEQRVIERTFEFERASRDLKQAQIQLLQREERLKYEAFHDNLTTLPNRTWFMQRLAAVIQFANQYPNYLYAVLFIDLDRFKVINDSLGHLIGDELLKNVAQRLFSCLRHSDTVARFGGDEFVILLEDLKDIKEAIAVAERIQEQLRIPFNLLEHEVYTGVSIGITYSTIGYQRPEDVLRDADVAMYQAKAKGKGRYEVLTNSMQTVALSRLQLETDLRRAVELQEFCLYYQPIVSLSTGCLKGFEALVRWYHPTRGWISPSEFIPVAEETGLINAIGSWVLKEGCHQVKAWQQQFDLPLAININLSAIQLKQANLLEQIEEILQASGLCRSCLKLEITESCILETVAWEEQMLRQLKALGIQLCIDDFGTGYSSLSRLHEFPIDTLKIDRSFVSRIGSKSDGIQIVQTIVTLAHSLRMDVVAEGIETIAQLERLQTLGYDLAGQGYLFSKPVNSQTVSQLLADPQQYQAMLPQKLKTQAIAPQQLSLKSETNGRNGNSKLRISRFEHQMG